MWPILGTIGLVLIESSYLPQLARLWKHKDARGISPLFPGLNLAGRLLAWAYALHSGAAVFSAGFALGVLLRLAFFALVLRYRVPPAPAAPAAPALRGVS